MKADDLALIASNVDGGGTGNHLKPVTLKTVLSNINQGTRLGSMPIFLLARYWMDIRINKYLYVSKP